MTEAKAEKKAAIIIEDEDITIEAIIEGCTLVPIGPQIVIVRDDPSNKSRGGIFLPETAKKKVKRGTVIRVGPGQRLADGKRYAPDLKPGDKIVFSMYAGNEVEHDEEWGEQEYVLMQEGEVLAGVGTIGSAEPKLLED